MGIKNHNTKREKNVMIKRLRIAVFIAVSLGIVLIVFRYFGFVSKTIYEESVSHLTEVFHQSDNMLRELTDKNLNYLHMWGENLQDISSEGEIRDYIKKAQEDAGFLDFFFLSADGNYKMATGETGYLGLQENIEDEIRQGNDVIANAAVPGKSQLLVFATAKAHGIYQGFEYDAIAIAYENSDIVDVLDISAFDGNAQSFVVHPDGRVVVDHSSEAWGNVYNFFGVLREHSDMSEKEINELSEKFKARRTDAMLLNLDGRNYYLVYEKSDIQDWMFLGLVQADIVNASMNSLQRSTILLVGAVVLCIAALLISFIIQKGRINLRKKDTEILYRDELFQKLSMNVDDVFLMLDAKTYQADYVSPNAEKLLGITVEQIRKDICILGKLHSEKQEDPEKNYKRGMDCIISGHGRVMEYVNVEMIIAGYSARVEREWYTHIGGSPTRLQSSTRYINYAGRGFDYIIPPSIQNNKEALEKYQALMAHINEECRALQEDYGIPKEDVANGLPLGMTASIVDKRNLRSLTEMSHQRMCNRAYWEYRQLFGDIRKALSEYSEEWRWIADNLFMPKCDYFGYCSETRPCGKPVSGVPKMPRP